MEKGQNQKQRPLQKQADEEKAATHIIAQAATRIHTVTNNPKPVPTASPQEERRKPMNIFKQKVSL